MSGSGGRLPAAPINPGTAFNARTPLASGWAPVQPRSTLESGPPVATGAALVTRQAPRSRAAKHEITLDGSGRTVAKLLENALPVAGMKLVLKIVGADNARLRVRPVLSHDVSHRFCEFSVVNDANRRPHVRASDRALLSPPPHDDDEISTAEDRAPMIAGDADTA